MRYVRAAVLLLCAAGAMRAQSASQPGTFQASARLVLVPVSVVDNYGKTIVGLHAGDFKIFDDQKPQQIVSFSSEDAPSSVALVLDASGSMRNAIGIAKDGAQALVREANPQDEFLLLTVSTQPASGPEFSSDLGAVARNISYTKSAGLTALIDAVYLGLNQMRKAAHPRRALVVFSDGMDNHSQYSRNQLLRVALEADVQIYTVILPTTGSSSPTQFPYRPSMIAKPGDRGPQIEGPELLETLAEKTGGLHFRAHDAAGAREAMRDVSEALRNQYVIGYQPADPGASGKSHRIRVTTTVPKVHLHARSGYYAP